MVRLLDAEIKTYERHRDHLLATAEGKFVLIKNDQVMGIYDSEMDAIRQGYQQLGNVAFLVKQVLRIEEPLNFVSNLLGV